MRRAALIVGLLTGIILFLYSMLLYSVARYPHNLFGITEDQEFLEMKAEAAAGGHAFSAMIMIVAASLAIKYPRASMVLFVIAAAIAILLYDLVFWGALSIFCAFLSFFGHLKGQRKPPIRVQTNWASIDSSEGVATGVSSRNFCTNCGKSIQPVHNYCVGCGTENKQITS